MSYGVRKFLKPIFITRMFFTSGKFAFHKIIFAFIIYNAFDNTRRLHRGGLFRGDVFRLKANACGRMDLHGRTRQSQTKRHGMEMKLEVRESHPRSLFPRYERTTSRYVDKK